MPFYGSFFGVSRTVQICARISYVSIVLSCLQLNPTDLIPASSRRDPVMRSTAFNFITTSSVCLQSETRALDRCWSFVSSHDTFELFSPSAISVTCTHAYVLPLMSTLAYISISCASNQEPFAGSKRASNVSVMPSSLALGSFCNQIDTKSHLPYNVVP